MQLKTILVILAAEQIGTFAFAQQPPDPPAMGTVEYKAHQRQLQGTRVTLEGQVNCQDITLCYLSDNGRIVFDASQVGDPDRERLLRCKENIASIACHFTVSGIAQSGALPAVMVDRIKP